MLRFLCSVVFSVFFAPVANAKILVFEALETDNSLVHWDLVLGIACPPLIDPNNCILSYSKIGSPTQAKKIIEQDPAVTTVNMSFAWQEPEFNPPPRIDESDPGYIKIFELFKIENANFQKSIIDVKKFITEHSEQFFVASAGHGAKISYFYTFGVALNEKLKIFPASFNNDNLIKVSAIQQSVIDPVNTKPYSRARYANFGLETVDVLAPVMLGPGDTVLKGTSFAVPFVSKIVDALFTKFSSITPTTMKKIVLRSCHVKNPQAAWMASMDLITNGTNSETYKAMFHRKRKVREQTQDKIGNIALVKCGGVLLKEVVETCAELVATQELSPTEACLQAHQNVRGLDENRLALLKDLWRIRQL